ncbi:MAG: pyridoxal phosphate-dependent aminotransferase [Pseudomonadota bacterium]
MDIVTERFADQNMMALTATKVRYDLAESVGPDVTLAQLLSESELTTLAELSLEYRPAQGSHELRQIIAQQHNCNANDVITTVGGMHAIFLCGEVLCTKGTHVLVQQPSFPMTQSALAFNNADMEFLPCRFNDGYRVDIEHLSTRLTPQTSLVCLASPQNPSGVAITKDEVSQILNAMKTRCPNAFLLVDETYRQAGYGTESPLASFSCMDERVITCASLSKCHGAPGLRIGWVITHHEALHRQLINGKFQTIICCSGLDEVVAMHVLQRNDSRMTDRETHLREGRNRVLRWVERHADQVSWVPPDAGALCCIRLRQAESEQHYVQRFHQALQQQSVRVAPGNWFGDEPEVFRLGFGLLPLDELTQALEAMRHALETLR